MSNLIFAITTAITSTMIAISMFKVYNMNKELLNMVVVLQKENRVLKEFVKSLELKDINV